MAEHSAVFNHDTKRYEAILFQRGRVLPDPELNEMQRIGRLRAYRTALLTSAAGRREGYVGRATCTNLEIVPGPNPDEISIRPRSPGTALLSYHGYVIELTEAITLSGLAAIPPGAGSQTQQIFMMLSETEISSADDPEIRLPGLEETAVRVLIRVEFQIGEPNVDTAATVSTEAEPWDGGVKAALLAIVQRYENGAGVALPITQTQILPSWNPPSDVAAFQDRNSFLACAIPETGAPSSGLVRWSVATNTLYFSNAAFVFPYPTRTSGFPHAVALDAEIIVLNSGDAVWLQICRGGALQGNDTAGHKNVLTSRDGETMFFDPGTATPAWRIIVAPMSELPDGAPTESSDDAIGNLYFIGVRVGAYMLMRDGRIIDGSEASDFGLGTNVHAFGGLRTFDMQASRTNSDHKMVPTLRERYVPAVGTFKLMFETYVTETVRSRMYYVNAYGDAALSGFVWTYNAFMLLNMTWRADDASLPSSIMRLGSGSALPEFSVAFRSEGESISWADNAWINNEGTSASIARSSLRYDGKNLDLAGSVRSVNTIRAFAKISVLGGLVTVDAGFGVEAVDLGTTGGSHLVVHLLDTFASASNIVATVTSHDGTNFTSYVTTPVQEFHGAHPGKAVVIHGYKLIAPGAVDFLIENARLSLIVVGALAS